MTTNLHFTADSIAASPETTEAYLVGLFEGTNIHVIYVRRVAIRPKYVQLARHIQGEQI